MSTRSTYYKGAQSSLMGPHFNNPTGSPYLPGSEHTDLLEVHSDYGRGIHFTSRTRVAARWAPVVLQVKVLGETFLIPEKVAPRYRPDIPASLAMGRYNKYRTDRLEVLGIVGIAAYGQTSHHARDMHLYGGVPDEVFRLHQWSVGSFVAAQEILRELNQTLARYGRKPMRFTGKKLETLRSDNFCLWELETTTEPELERITVTLDANLFVDLRPADWQDQVGRTVERALGSLSYVQTTGDATAWPPNRRPIGT